MKSPAQGRANPGVFCYVWRLPNPHRSASSNLRFPRPPRAHLRARWVQHDGYCLRLKAPGYHPPRYHWRNEDMRQAEVRATTRRSAMAAAVTIATWQNFAGAHKHPESPRWFTGDAVRHSWPILPILPPVIRSASGDCQAVRRASDDGPERGQLAGNRHMAIRHGLVRRDSHEDAPHFKAVAVGALEGIKVYRSRKVLSGFIPNSRISTLHKGQSSSG
jgi:hypothetical protein